MKHRWTENPERSVTEPLPTGVWAMVIRNDIHSASVDWMDYIEHQKILTTTRPWPSWTDER